MATLANTTAFRGIRTDSDFPAMVITYGEGSSQSFTLGDIVVLSSGYVIIAPVTSTQIAAGTLLLGKPGRAATGTQYSNIPVHVFTDSTLVSLPYSAADAGAAIAASAFGVKVGIDLISGVWTANSSDTTDTKVIPQSFSDAPDNSEAWAIPGRKGLAWTGTGETGGHLWCKVMATMRVLG